MPLNSPNFLAKHEMQWLFSIFLWYSSSIIYSQNLLSQSVLFSLLCKTVSWEKFPKRWSVLIKPDISEHPWVREGGETLEIPIDIFVLSNMQQFVKYSRLKQFATRVREINSSIFMLEGEILYVFDIITWFFRWKSLW